METTTPKLKKATPEEFERLLRGETVELSLEGYGVLNCLTKNQYNQEIILIEDLVVKGGITLKREYKYNIEIKGNSILEDFSISGEAKTGNFSISGVAKTGNFRISGEAETGDFRIYDQANTGGGGYD